uniref:Uncharacterized protein n=1 Tax=Nelumbo nucifera TaxID=4432 RepID=A0A822YNE8_NELNU|nr:TPA_asm: hypothetical protein HUJ06_011256 [Nelumbo nucifera]DAD32406.1 TPA_asm: hypothetical protein HUJ06_011257 [Nelumbo nucifera]
MAELSLITSTGPRYSRFRAGATTASAATSVGGGDGRRHGPVDALAGTAPRWIPKRGAILKGILRKVFSVLCFSSNQRLPSRSSTVTPSPAL